MKAGALLLAGPSIWCCHCCCHRSRRSLPPSPPAPSSAAATAAAHNGLAQVEAMALHGIAGVLEPCLLLVWGVRARVSLQAQTSGGGEAAGRQRRR